jgi:hypothetical protein
VRADSRRRQQQIRAAAAACILEQARPSGAVQTARHELAAEYLTDLRRIDAQRRDAQRGGLAQYSAAATAGLRTIRRPSSGHHKTS